MKRSVENPIHGLADFNAASAKMIEEFMDNLPVIPAPCVQEIKNPAAALRGSRVDRLIVPYVPVTEPDIDDAHGFVEAWGKL